MKEHDVVQWFSDLGHPEDRRDVDGWFEDHWEGRPESRGLESAVREGGADVESIDALGKEDPDESRMESHLRHGRDWSREWGLEMARLRSVAFIQVAGETGHGPITAGVIQT